MKTYYYDLDRGYFVNTAGGVIAITPTLVYGEQAEWRFFFKTAAGAVYDLSNLTELTAAVGVAGGSTVAATTEGIAVDTAAGSVTVPIDCLTEEFLAATQGKPNGVYGFFELTGYDAAQGKALYLRFNVLLNEVVNPDITTIPGLADRVLAIVSSGGYVKSDGVAEIAEGAAETVISSGGYVNSSGAAQIASGAAQTAASSAVSSALFSNTEIDTTVGDYLLTYTSSGGLMVSGGGVQLQVSSGAVVAKYNNGDEILPQSAMLTLSSGGVAAEFYNGIVNETRRVSLDGDRIIAAGASGEKVVLSGGTAKMMNENDGTPQYIAVHSEGVDISVSDPARNVNISCYPGKVLINGRPVLTDLATATDAETTSAALPILSGGMSYKYTAPLYSLEVDSVVKTTEASYLHFALDSVTAVNPVVISGVSYLNSATFEGGKEYLVGIFDGMAVVNEVTSGGVLQ